MAAAAAHQGQHRAPPHQQQRQQLGRAGAAHLAQQQQLQLPQQAWKLTHNASLLQAMEHQHLPAAKMQALAAAQQPAALAAAGKAAASPALLLMTCRRLQS
jgi:hypothetical protein